MIAAAISAASAVVARRLTSGPMTSARTGIQTVDVGAAQLAMYSARELMGAHDVAAYSAALRAFLSPE